MKDFFHLCLSGHHAVAECPQQDVEDGHKRARVEKTFASEQRADQRKSHVGGIGKSAGEADDCAILLCDSSRCEKSEDQSDQKRERAEYKSREQVVKGRRVKFDEIGVNDHCRDNEIDQDIGEHRLFRWFEDAGLTAEDTC